MRRIKTILYPVAVVGLALLTYELFNSSKTLESVAPPHKDNYRIESPPIPESIDFAGENVPLDIDDVRERLDRELIANAYFHSNTILLMKRSHRWFPLIESILKEEKVPIDFKYLALVESGLVNVTSPAGAKGYWQFMESTAKSYGLKVNGEIDERYHMEKATRAACKYLKNAKGSFGSWTMAAAAYNIGEKRLNQRLEEQMVKDYYDLLLNEETGRYIFRLLALKEMVENPGKFGFQIETRDMYKPFKYRKVEVNSGIKSWAEFALDEGINYKILKLHNPWLRKPFLTNKENETFVILIPK